MKKNTNTTTEVISAEMIQAIRDAGGRNVYVMTERSRSGMSKRLSFHMVFNGRLVEINHFIKPDLSLDRHWVRVNGCGFDAIASTLSAFYSRNGIPADAAYHYSGIYTKDYHYSS